MSRMGEGTCKGKQEGAAAILVPPGHPSLPSRIVPPGVTGCQEPGPSPGSKLYLLHTRSCLTWAAQDSSAQQPCVQTWAQPSHFSVGSKVRPTCCLRDRMASWKMTWLQSHWHCSVLFCCPGQVGAPSSEVRTSLRAASDFLQSLQGGCPGHGRLCGPTTSLEPPRLPVP